MNATKNQITIAVVAGLLIIAGIYAFSNSDNKMEKDSMVNPSTSSGQGKDEAAIKEESAVMDKKDGAMMDGGDTMMKKDEAMMDKKDDGAMMTKYTGTVLAGKSAPLLEFNKVDYDTAIASDKLVVLYFYANWCPICKDEVANALIPAFNELITDKVVGIRINYKDNETDSNEKALAVKYGIPYQHTKVFVKDGKQILKAPDGWNKARYTTEINKALAQ